MPDKARIDAKTALKVAASLLAELEPVTAAITIAGSLRRQKPEVGDVEILAIPKLDGITNLLELAIQGLIDREILDYRLNKKGYKVCGPQNKLLLHVPSSIPVDIFITDANRWPVALVVRTGGKETNLRIAKAAIKKGWHLLAYGNGFWTPQGNIKCSSEREIFEAVGLPYKEPWERD